MSNKYLLSLLLFTSLSYADCTQKPTSDKIKEAINVKNYTQAKNLLTIFENEVKAYEKKCDKSKEMHEELNVLLLTCQDYVADLKEDMDRGEITLDCSVVPSASKLQEAFNASEHDKIKQLYPAYKKNSDNYIQNCTSEASYGEVYETSMLCDERYEEWKKSGY